MIDLYSGTPGSGKSLHTARIIQNRLKAGWPVITNFPINVDYVKRYKRNHYYVPNDKLTPELLRVFSSTYFAKARFAEEKIMVVIDEAQLLFNAREWDMQGRKEWLSFFTQHRKFGYYVVLVAQFDRMLDRQIRSLIEYEHVHRKFSNYGVFGKIFSLFAGGKLFIDVKMWYPLKERVGIDLFRAVPRYYRLYDTYSLFDGSDTNNGNNSK